MILSTLFVVFWTLLPLADLLDGAIEIRGGSAITVASEPFGFWLLAIVAVTAEIFALCQIAIAADAWLNQDPS